MISFALLGQVFGIAGKKIAVWYRNVLSGFTKPEVQQVLHQHDTVDQALIDHQTGEIKTVYVPILKPENFGEHMALDDKNIDGEGYTILSNKKTGKIALLASTTKYQILAEILQKIPVSIRYATKTISRDLAVVYDWLSRTMFLGAQSVADKFHVVKLALEALQDIRVRYRQEVLTKEREAKKKCAPKQKSVIYENGDTIKELLRKSRYLLFTFSSTWRESQVARATILFREFPDLEVAYQHVCWFRRWYKKSVDKEVARTELRIWYAAVEKTKIPELLNLIASIKKHEGVILNYFSTNQTNAFAESLNSRIAACVRMGYGVRDTDFFHFRLRKYFSESAPEKSP